MRNAEFEAGLAKFLPVLRRKLDYLHGDGPLSVRRFEEEAALEWIVPLLERTPPPRDVPALEEERRQFGERRRHLAHLRTRADYLERLVGRSIDRGRVATIQQGELESIKWAIAMLEK